MATFFCELEKDEKSFSYVKEYITKWHQGNISSFSSIDMNITAKEIAVHMFLNDKIGDSQEALNWIKKYGEPFRSYLNTIKLVFIVWYCSGNKWEDIAWNNFCQIRDNLIEVKSACIDTLLLDSRL